MTPQPRPWVQVACVCEKVLVEPDNVASLIRVVDTYTVDLPSQPLPPGVILKTDLTAFVSLKSGEVKGEHEVGLRMNSPAGKSSAVRRWPVEFRGEESGANFKIQFTLDNPVVGLYWFDVLWGDDVLTRIPFRLKSREPKAEPDVPSTPETS